MYKTILLLLFFLQFFCFESIYAENILQLDGQLDIIKEQLLVKVNLQEKGSLSINIQKQPNNILEAFISISHLKTPLFEISTELNGSLEVIEKEDKLTSVLFGKVESRYTLINYRPIRELVGQFEVTAGRLYLNTLSMGGISGHGAVNLFYPYEVNLTLVLADIKMEDFLSFWMKEKTTLLQGLESDGLVSGEIQVSGVKNNFIVKGNLSSFHGFVSQLNFNSINLNFEGEYPIIYLTNSSVAQTDGLTFNLEGSLNLDDRENFLKQINTLSKSPLVHQRKDQLEWTLKRLKSESDSSVTEFKYLIRKKENFEGGSDKEEMLGIERRTEF